jgi:hypothetical protein
MRLFVPVWSGPRTDARGRIGTSGLEPDAVRPRGRHWALCAVGCHHRPRPPVLRITGVTPPSSTSGSTGDRRSLLPEAQAPRAHARDHRVAARPRATSPWPGARTRLLCRSRNRLATSPHTAPSRGMRPRTRRRPALPLADKGRQVTPDRDARAATKAGLEPRRRHQSRKSSKGGSDAAPSQGVRGGSITARLERGRGWNARVPQSSQLGIRQRTVGSRFTTSDA